MNSLKVSPSKYLLITEGKNSKRNMVIKDNTLTKWSRIISQVTRHVNILLKHWGYVTSVVFPKIYNLNVTMKKYQPTWRIFYKIPNQYSSQVSRSWKKQRLRNHHWLGRLKGLTIEKQSRILEWIPERKKESSDKNCRNPKSVIVA